jgi:hypothetical protein
MWAHGTTLALHMTKKAAPKRPWRALFPDHADVMLPEPLDVFKLPEVELDLGAPAPTATAHMRERV